LICYKFGFVRLIKPQLAAIEARFKGRGAWKKGLPTLLQTLAALGRAQQVGDEGAALWRA
jgi:hypothetical protein